MTTQRILHIGIASHEDVKRRTLAITRGKIRPGKDEPKVWFTSPAAMSRVFSPFNMGLIKVIREQAPGSVKELADLVGAQRSNVARSLGELERYGVIGFHSGPQGRKAPYVRYDRIIVVMELERAA